MICFDELTKRAFFVGPMERYFAYYRNFHICWLVRDKEDYVLTAPHELLLCSCHIVSFSDSQHIYLSKFSLHASIYNFQMGHIDLMPAIV